MTSARTPIAALLATLFWGTAVAAPPDGDYGTYVPHHMMNGGWMMGPIMMFLFFALLVAAVVLVVRLVGGAGGAGRADTSRADRSLEILRERYAKGEIDSAEFEERRRALRH